MKQLVPQSPATQSSRLTILPVVLLMALLVTACGGAGEVAFLEQTPDRVITAANLPPKAMLDREKVGENEEDLLSFQNRFDPWVVKSIHQEIKFAGESEGAVVLEMIESKYVEAAKNVYGKLSHLVKNLHPVIREGRKVYEVLGPRDNLLLASKVMALSGFAPDLYRAWEGEITRTNDRLEKLRAEAQKEYEAGWEAQKKLLQDIKEGKILD